MSNLLIGLAYFSIPISILYVVRKRKDVDLRWVYVAFAAFIFSCGFGHIVDILTIWRPMYYFEGWVKSFTAFMSVATAIGVVKVLPKITALPSPALLESVNRSLKDANETHELVLDSVSGGLLVWPDVAHKEVQLSPRLFEVLGLRRESFPQTLESFLELIHPDERDDALERLDRHLHDGGAYVTELRLRNDRGEYRWFRVRGNSLVSPEGRRKLAVSIEDIHEGKLAQIDLEEQRRHLEAAVKERTRDLEETVNELRLARAQAEKASVAKTRFLANMSHEIRTPLGIVIGFSRLLLDSKQLPEELQSYSSTIRKNGELLLSIINSILDLSKIESGQMSPEVGALHPAELLQDIRTIFDLRCRERGLEFELHRASSVPDVVYTDSVKVKQILVNLLNNAIKFTARGRVSVDLGYRSSPRGSHLLLTVRDTGKGIDPSKTEEIFGMFSQEDSSISRSYGGSGLGLHLSQKLAHVLGGTLTLVSSIPGRGSEFQASVLDHKEMPESARNSGTSASARDTSRRAERRLRVLVVDDAEENLRLMGLMLKRMGVDSELCSDPQQVTKLARENPWDLILMDIQMPVMDGFQVLRALRSDADFRTPVWALTAQSFREEVEEIFAAGFDDYVGKPVDFDLLGEKLRRL